MNPIYLVQVFLLAVTVVKSARTFFAKVNGSYKRLKKVTTPEAGLVTFDDLRFSSAPLFNLNNGIATTKKGKPSEVSGMFNEYYAIGLEGHVTPFKLQLDYESKVINLHMHLCTQPLVFLPKMTVNGISNSPGVHCFPIDVYFLSSGEVKKRVHRLRGKTTKVGDGVP